MIVLVAGSRDWISEQIIRDMLTALNPTAVIHGACPTGADWYAHVWCEDHPDVIEDPHPAKWHDDDGKYSKRAGFLRNAEMVALKPDLVLAFRRNNSRGTNITIKLAQDAGIPVEILEETGETP